jgi:hypothetical protein
MQNRMPVGAIVAAIVVLVASFVPWGLFDMPTQVLFGFGNFGAMCTANQHFTFNRPAFAMTINGWNGHLIIFGMIVPNWLVVVAAAAIATIAVLVRFTDIHIPRFFSPLLSAYGVVHCGMAAYFLGPTQHLGLGVLLSLFAFVALLGLSVRDQ